MNDAKRAEIAQAILDMAACVEFETVVAAQCDALATLTGAVCFHSGKSCADAEKLVRVLVEDMAVRHIRRHWGSIEVHG